MKERMRTAPGIHLLGSYSVVSYRSLVNVTVDQKVQAELECAEPSICLCWYSPFPSRDRAKYNGLLGKLLYHFTVQGIRCRVVK